MLFRAAHFVYNERNWRMIVKEIIIMEEKQVLDLGALTQVAGGQDWTPVKDPFEP